MSVQANRGASKDLCVGGHRRDNGMQTSAVSRDRKLDSLERNQLVARGTTL